MFAVMHFLRLAARAAWHAASHWLLAALALVLGGTTFLAVEPLARAAEAAAGQDLAAVAGKAALRAQWSGPSAEFAAACRATPELVVAMPRLVRSIVVRAGREVRTPLFGLDLGLEALVQGAPLAALELDGPARDALADPHAVFVSRALAAACGVALGGELAVGDGVARELARVRGLFTPTPGPGAGSMPLLVAGLPLAQRVLRCPDVVDVWDLVLVPGADPGVVAAAFGTRLAGRGTVRGATAHRQVEQALARWRTTLRLFGALAACIALWTVALVLAAVVERQRPQLWMLHVLGARRPVVALLCALPAALIGAVAGAGSAAIAPELAALLLPVGAASGGAARPFGFLWPALLGLTLCLGAAWLGAVRALRGASPATVRLVRSGPALLAGALCLGLLLVAAALHWSRDRALVRAGNAALAVAGLTLLVPPLARWLGARALWSGVAAWLVRRRIAHHPDAVDAPLRVLALLAAFLVLVAALSGGLAARGGGALVPYGARDLLAVSLRGWFDLPAEAPIEPLAETLRTDPAVAAVTAGAAPHLPLRCVLRADADPEAAAQRLAAPVRAAGLELVAAAPLLAQADALWARALAFLDAIAGLVAVLALLAALVAASQTRAGREAERRTLLAVGLDQAGWRRVLALETLALGVGTALAATGYALVVAWAWSRWTLADVAGDAVPFVVPWRAVGAVVLLVPAALALPRLVPRRAATAW